jgi:uncharacterized protein YceK
MKLTATILTSTIGLAGCGTLESQSHARFHRELAESEENVETAITTEHHRISCSMPCPDQLVYGGVVNRCALGLQALTSRDGQAGAALIFGGPFLLVDFCLSAVLDTLIVPVTIYQQVIDEQPDNLNDARTEIPPPPGAASNSP